MPVATITNGDDRLNLAYVDEGEGDVVLLVHGFASTKEVNWVDTGWVAALTQAGFRVIAHDNRGHGASTKFYAESDYRLDKLAGDAVALLDHLEIRHAHLVGYSMGARISATVAVHHGDRVGKLVLSGGGWAMVEGTGDWTPVRDALLAPGLEAVTDPRARTFRAFADKTGSDRRALAACVTGVRQLLVESELRTIANPVLVAVGTEDDVAGSGERLAQVFRNGRYLPIPRRDHMKAVGDRAHIAGVIDFLAA